MNGMAAGSAFAALEPAGAAAKGWHGAPAFVDTARLFRLVAPELPPGLLVQAWTACEALDAAGEMELLCVAPDAHLDPSAMLARPLTLVATLADGRPFERRGLVVQAEAEDADGGFARYRLRVRGWLALLEHGLHSRLWQRRTLAEVLADVFEPYRPFASWRLAESVDARLSRDARHDAAGRRDCTQQHRESDLGFVRRLLAAHGLVLRVDPATDTVHVLDDTCDPAQCPQDPSSERCGGLRLHRADPTEAEDAVLELACTTRLPPAGLVATSADAVAARTLHAAIAGAPGLRLRPAVGADAFHDGGAARRRLQLLLQAQQARTRVWQGRSTVRSFAAGHWFVMRGDAAPPPLLLTRVLHVGCNDLVAGTRWPPGRPPAPLPLHAAWLPPDLLVAAQLGGYANEFLAASRSLPWRPEVEPRSALPARGRALGLWGATVVGEPGAAPGSVCVDALGRIRVRPDCLAPEIVSPGAATSAATGWLRVLQRWAGAGVGAQFLPRVGQRVLLDFLDDDVERPVVVGALYDGCGEGGVAPTPGGQPVAPRPEPPGGGDHHPGGQGNEVAGAHAPPWHGASPAPRAQGGQANAAAMSGFKSRELGGAGWNQLVFDDSDEALRVQLASTQAGSQLNLGRLVHQADNRRGSERGQGFELRSDAAGALRAAQGLLLTTGALASAGPAGDNTAGIALLRQLDALVHTLAEAAAVHATARACAVEPAGGRGMAPLAAVLAARVDSADFDAARRDAGQGGRGDGSSSAASVPQMAQPMLVAQAGAGIVAAARTLVQAAAGSLTHAAGGDLDSLSTRSWQLHSGGGIGVLAGALAGSCGVEAGAAVAAPPGLGVTAVSGDAELRADGGDATLAARDALMLHSVSGRVHLQAGRRLVLATEGGAGITFAAGDLRLECPGTLTVQASQRHFVGPPAAA